jgi:hypothetical protein
MIGITGVARSGKDTLYKLLEKRFSQSNIKCQRFALADNLKNDLRSFILEKFDINIDNVSQEDKELIRPIMVAYGKCKRLKTNGRYWIDLLNNDLDKNNLLPIVTDIRYDEYEKDEYFWLKKEKLGILIHITRIFNGKVIEPANDEEYRNNKKLYEKADYKFIWCTESDLGLLYENNLNILEEIYQIYARSRIN